MCRRSIGRLFSLSLLGVWLATPSIAHNERSIIEKGSDSLSRYLLADTSKQDDIITDFQKPIDSSNATPVRRVFYGFEDEKTPVNPQDLPRPIKSALKGEKFRNWNMATAQFVKPQDGGASYYEIALQRDKDTHVAKLKGNGKML